MQGVGCRGVGCRGVGCRACGVGCRKSPRFQNLGSGQVALAVVLVAELHVSQGTQVVHTTNTLQPPPILPDAVGHPAGSRGSGGVLRRVFNVQQFGISGLGGRVSGFWFRYSVFGFQFSGLGSRVSGFVFQVSVFSGFGSRSGFRFRVSGLGFWISGLGSRVSGFGSRVSDLGFRVSIFRFRSSVFGFRDSSIDTRQATAAWGAHPEG